MNSWKETHCSKDHRIKKSTTHNIILQATHTALANSEKTAPDAPEKHQISINTNKPASKVRFILKVIKPVTNRKRFQCSLKCDRLHTQQWFKANALKICFRLLRWSFYTPNGFSSSSRFCRYTPNQYKCGLYIGLIF